MILKNTQTGFLDFAEAESFTMSNISPVLPFYLLVVHLVISAFVLCLCLLSFAAILRTKKTPYPTKLLSLGLLVYDCLFIISANGGKFFRHEDNFVFRQLSRAFQMAAQLIVLFLAFERLFVLNWPYVFLRVGTRGRIRKVCIAIVILSCLQYILFQGLVCYTRGKFLDCTVELAVYYLLLCTLDLFAQLRRTSKFSVLSETNRLVWLTWNSSKEQAHHLYIYSTVQLQLALT